MPAHYTFPTLLDEVKQVSITKLKEYGYMNPDNYKPGRLIWSSKGQEIGSIRISVDMTETPQAIFFYTYNKEEQVNFRVKLTSTNSNLGKSKIWYFVCPHTSKRCLS